jgi:hypothetical protein
MTTESNPINISVYAPSAGGLMSPTDRRKTEDFIQELEEAVRDLEKAAKASCEVNDETKSLLHTLESRGWWDQLTAGLSGSTDKELANLVKGLGVNLIVTQKIIRIILKVLTQKNQVLHAFNRALINKITLVSADTRTLDKNQNAIVRVFLSQLQQQVMDQIEQQEMVDRHESRLLDLDDWRDEKQSHDNHVSAELEILNKTQQQAFEHIRANDSQYQAIATQVFHLAQRQADEITRIAVLQQQVQTTKDKLDAIDQCNRDLTNRSDAAETRCIYLNEQVRLLTERAMEAEARFKQSSDQVGDLQRVNTEQEILISDIEQRFSLLERIDGTSRLAHSRLLRHAPAATALIIAVVAFLLPLIQ